MFADDNFEDILGPPIGVSYTEQSGKRGPGRPPGTKNKPKDNGVAHLTTASLNEVMTGVPIPFLVQVFRMGRQTVQERLKPLNPIKHGANGAPYYDLQRAAEHLVDPKLDLKTYLLGLSPDDLPQQLRDSYWSAKLKRQKFEENAGDLWRSEDVQEVLGEVFRIIKTRTQLVADTLDDKHGLTQAQRDSLSMLLDGMLNAIREGLIEMASTRQTMNQKGQTTDV